MKLASGIHQKSFCWDTAYFPVCSTPCIAIQVIKFEIFIIDVVFYTTRILSQTPCYSLNLQECDLYSATQYDRQARHKCSPHLSIF